MSVKKPNPKEMAILALTRADKRCSILPILLEENNYLDIVEEVATIVEQSIKGIVYNAEVLPEEGEDPTVAELLTGAQEQLADEPRQLVPQLLEALQVSAAAAERYGVNGQKPTRRTAKKLIAHADFCCQLAERTIKSLDGR